MTDEKKVTKKVESAEEKADRKKKPDTVQVKNISNKKINLTHGIIEPEKTGKATPAELSTLFNYLEKA